MNKYDVTVSVVSGENAERILQVMREFIPRKAKKPAFTVRMEEYQPDPLMARIVASEVTEQQENLLTAIAYAYTMGKHDNE